jgi:hypothetical protein
LVVLLAVCGLAAMVAAAQATVIDDFSVDSSAKYSELTTYNGGGVASYGVDNGQFAPSGWGNTTDWLRSDGYTFDVGSTVSIEILQVVNSDSATGLGLNQSLTSDSNGRGYYIQYRPYLGGTGMTWNTNQQLADFDSGFTHGPAKISLTRTSGTSLNYSLDYFKTDGSAAQLTGSDTIAAGTYYFGMMSYTCGNTRWDNLSYTAVPEPMTLYLLATGSLGLLAYAWRKRRS